MSRANKSFSLTEAEARRIWLRAQRLDTQAPFGEGPQATAAAVEHLGYVQIDTINVIERCHHHILWNRIPAYRRADLRQAQSVDKSVFEYWTHALSYVPAKDLRFFLPAMKRHRREGHKWFGSRTTRGARNGGARCRSATATTTCWWTRSIFGPAASRRSGRCNWRSTPACSRSASATAC